MMKSKLTLPLSVLTTCVTLLAAPVQAQSVSLTLEPILVAANQTTKEANAPRHQRSLPDRSDWISLKDAFDALEKAGYEDLHGIHLSHDGYIARALDSEKKRVLLRIDPKTSEITVQEARSRKGSKHKHRKPTEASDV